MSLFRDLSIARLLILFALVSLLFGYKRIPEIGRSIGKGIREFKNGLVNLGRPLRSGGRDEHSENSLACA